MMQIRKLLDSDQGSSNARVSVKNLVDADEDEVYRSKNTEKFDQALSTSASRPSEKDAEEEVLSEDTKSQYGLSAEQPVAVVRVQKRKRNGEDDTLSCASSKRDAFISFNARKRRQTSKVNSGVSGSRQRELLNRRSDSGSVVVSSKRTSHNLKANANLVSRGVSRHFSAQIARAWAEMPVEYQNVLLKFSIFPGSFSIRAAVAVQGLSDSKSAIRGRDLTSQLTTKSLLQLDPSSGRYEINERVRPFIRRKAESTCIDLTPTFKYFVDFFMSELTHFEDQARPDTIRAYTISTKNFELEKANILHAFDLASRNSCTDSDLWLTGSYLMRYTLDAKSRLQIYQQAFVALMKTPKTRTRKESQTGSRLLLVYGRAHLDALNYKEAKEPLLASASILQGLLNTSQSAAERKELLSELIVIKQSLARLYNELGDYETALQNIMECIQYRKGSGESGTVPFAICLGVLAQILIHMGVYEDAKKVLLEEISMFEHNRMENSHDYAIALELLASVAAQQNDTAMAKNLLITALDKLQLSSLPYQNYGYLEGKILQELGSTISAEGNKMGGQQALQLAVRSYNMAGFNEKKNEVERILSDRRPPSKGARSNSQGMDFNSAN
mmetsp:Transcript_7559/g.22933  ORF Transcript_7559/g.22933 Transcript_7559/m.22933 type:complete len:614 (-) Transcript_7559:48-1889(-)